MARDDNERRGTSDPAAQLPTGFRWASLFAFMRSLLIARGRRGYAALALVAAGALVEGLGLVMLVPVIGLVLDSGSPGGMRAMLQPYLGSDRQIVLITALAAFLMVMILRGAVLYLRDRATWRLQAYFVAEQRNAIVRKLAAARWSALVRLEHAQITSQLSGEIARISAATTMLFQAIVAIGMLLVQGALALALAPGLGSLVIGLLVLLALPVALRFNAIAGLGNKANRGGAELMSSIGHLLSGLKVAQAQGMQARFIADFEALQERHLDYQRDFSLGRARDTLIFGVGSSVGGAMLVWLGLGVFALKPAVLITLIVIFSRLSGPIRSLQASLPQLVYMLPAYESISRLAVELDAARAGARTREPLDDGALRFDRAAYLHPQGRGLREASFSIAPGEVVGICGPSGGGKTTLLDLATGLVEPQSGTITVGATPLNAGNVAAWADRIAYATQEPFLFHNSIRHNVAWGTDADDEAIWAALEAMGAGPLVRAKPLGLATIIGDRGALFSGGERQRLILARALLRRPGLLILDEATSSLDAPSEAAILKAFRAMTPTPAILFVTHRAESLANCDRVLRLEDGAILA